MAIKFLILLIKYLTSIIHCIIFIANLTLEVILENGLVKIENNDLVVGTWDLSKGFQIEHRAIKNIIEKHKLHFEDFGPVRKCDISGSDEDFTDPIRCIKYTMNKPKKRGGQVQQFIINEEQYVFLGTLLPNSENIVIFKKKLTKEFFKMRKVLIKLTVQHQNEQWRLQRAQGKIERRLETDAIKEFIEYAKSQGSKSADNYYMIITNMENKSLVNIEIIQQKFKNVRDILEGFDLTSLQMADKIVAVSLREGMTLGMFYKDIYIMSRDRVEAFALTIGKMPFRLSNETKKKIRTYP